MVDNVTDDKLTASSSFLGNAIIGLTTPDMAKLSNKGWCPIQNDLVPWIQVFVCFCKQIKCEKSESKSKSRFNVQLENRENILLHKI